MISFAPTLVEARGNAAQRAGIYYERRVADYFCGRYLCAVQPTITLRGVRRRPDLLVFDPECHACVVVEVKLSFTVGALIQLTSYVKLVHCALPWVKVGALVVCKNYEPQAHLRFQAPLRLVDETQLFTLSERPEAVWVLSDRQLRIARAARSANGLDFCRGLSQATVREPGSTGHSVRSCS